MHLINQIHLVQKRFHENDIEIKKSKKAVLKIRVDKRKPNDNVDQIQGYPILKSYKYDGIIIQNNLKNEDDKKKRKNNKSYLKNKIGC